MSKKSKRFFNDREVRAVWDEAPNLALSIVNEFIPTKLIGSKILVESNNAKILNNYFDKQINNIIFAVLNALNESYTFV